MYKKGMIELYKYHRIRDLREDNDLSQPKCAEIFLIGKNTYIRYEKGETIPPLDVMERIADFYNVSIDYLAGRTDKREMNE